MLRRAGLLSDGRVSNVAVESSRQMLVSRVMRLRLEVEGQDGAAPVSVFFKTGRADGPISAEAIGRAQVDFYSRVAPLTPAGLLPRCFEAAAGAGCGWHLLLEDLTDSHDIASAWPLPPTAEQCDRRPHDGRAAARVRTAGGERARQTLREDPWARRSMSDYGFYVIYALDLELVRHEHDVGVNVLRHDGDVQIMVVM